MHQRIRVPNQLYLTIGSNTPHASLLLQFDGSAHKQQNVGGAGIAVFIVQQSYTQLIHWEAIVLPSCKDNVHAEGQACLRTFQLAHLLFTQLSSIYNLTNGIIQGDILPILNRIAYQARWKNPDLLPLLDECRKVYSYISPGGPAGYCALAINAYVQYSV